MKVILKAKFEALKNWNIKQFLIKLRDQIYDYKFNWKHLFGPTKLLIILLVSIFIIFPIYYLITFSFFTNNQATSNTTALVSENYTWNAYVSAFENGYGNAFLYTFIFVGIVSLLRLIILILAAYGIVVLNKKFKALIYSLIILLASIPEVTLHLGYLKLSTNFGWTIGLNVLNALIFPNLFSIFITIIFVNAFSSVEKQKRTMARLDNLPFFTRIRIIYWPAIKTGFWISIFFSIIFSWNSFIWPLIILSSSDIFVLSIWFRLTGTTSGGVILQNVVAAGAVLTTLPVIIFYFIFANKINKVSATLFS